MVPLRGCDWQWGAGKALVKKGEALTHCFYRLLLAKALADDTDFAPIWPHVVPASFCKLCELGLDPTLRARRNCGPLKRSFASVPATGGSQAGACCLCRQSRLFAKLVLLQIAFEEVVQESPDRCDCSQLPYVLPSGG